MVTNQDKQVLANLVTIFKELECPMILVGGGARLLIFDLKFGEGRSTTDWDVAVSLEGWEAYEKLREKLVNGDPPHFKIKTAKISHKFVHIATNIEVDIVPFGEIGEPDKQIFWSESDNLMNLLGFSEALSHAKTEIIDGLEIQVINIPTFVVLKVFAWGDRGESTNKDLEDIEFILSKYEDDDRVYYELVEELSSGSVDFIDANIYLLGQDIHKMLQDKTLTELNILLEKMIKKFDYDEERSFGYMLKVLQQGIYSLNSKT